RETCAPLGVHVSNWLGYTDPPKHTRLKNLLRTTFTPALAKAMEPRIQTLTDELLDGVAASDDPDLVSGFAFPLPATVICEILGTPGARIGPFPRWPDDRAASTGHIGPTLVEIAPRAMGSYVELEEFIAEMVADRRGDASKDLLAHLAAAEGNGEL